MELERISVAIRPRRSAEAIDLGLRMVRDHARAVYAPWLILSGGVALFLALALPRHPWIALLLFWFGLPLYDRVVVHVLSHALFGNPPRWRDTLAALPALLRKISPNPLERIDFTRSFNLPVIQLEELKRGRRARRIDILQRQSRSQAVGLSLAFLVFEWILAIGLLALPSLLLPEGLIGKLEIDLATSSNQELVAPWLLYAAYVISVLFLEPFYIGAGFSLYLNRRALLEGWDLEIGLRKIARRLAPALFLLALLPALTCLTATDLHAGTGAGNNPPPNEAAPDVIREVLADPAFGHVEKLTRWRRKDDGKADNPEQTSGLLEWLLNSVELGETVAGALRVALWTLALAGLAWLIWRRERWMHLLDWRRRPKSAADDASRVIAGVDVDPDSLPKDIPRAVQALWNQERHREAMSLLYRGTLAALIEHKQLKVDESCTEQDCIDAVERLETPAISRHFRDLTTLWQLLAYGHRLPETRLVEHLCHQWWRLYRRKDD